LNVASASWVPFSINSLIAGQSAQGYEQVFQVVGTAGNGLPVNTFGYDYTFLVMNSGTLPIDGFFFDVGVPNTPVAVKAFVTGAQGNDTFTAPGGADPGIFPNAVVGGPRPTQNISGELGVLNPYAFGSIPLYTINGAGVNPIPPLQGLLQTWGFEQFWNPGMTSYLARFYANTPLNPYGALPPGYVTRFDVFSPLAPVPGGGGVDPLSTGNYFGIDDGLGDLSNLILSPGVGTCDPNPGATNPCDASLPAGILGIPAFGNSTTSVNVLIPEPGTVALMMAGLSGIVIVRRRSTRG
jgi:hypothetical protein